MNKDKVNEQAIWAGAWLLFGVLMLLVPRQFDWGWYDKIVDLATAVGTVGAVVVSLWLAGSERRLRERDAVMSARLVATRVSADLRAPLQSMQMMLTSGSHPDNPYKPWLDENKEQMATLNYELLRLECSRNEWDLSPLQLQGLAALGELVAQRLEYGCRAIVSLNKVMTEYIHYWAKMPLEHKNALIDEWMQDCNEAFNFITWAHRECQRVADVGAPPPIPNEA